MRLLIPLFAASALLAAEAAPPPAPPSADPTTAVVAEGSFTYRQRDLDALLLVAMRHARAKELSADGKPTALGTADEDSVRQVLIRALVAREALLAAFSGLPERIPPAARDAIALDVLAYQADPSRAAAPPATAPAPVAAAGPAIVRLPPFTINRTIEGQGRRQLTIGLAIAFSDAAQAAAMEAGAPVLQDAVLGALRSLPPSAFTEPDHGAIKKLLTDAIRAKLPAFPAEGLLIPQLEAAAEAAPEK